MQTEQDLRGFPLVYREITRDQRPPAVADHGRERRFPFLPFLETADTGENEVNG